jgi:hypothetical protein
MIPANTAGSNPTLYAIACAGVTNAQVADAAIEQRKFRSVLRVMFAPLCFFCGDTSLEWVQPTHVAKTEPKVCARGMD